VEFGAFGQGSAGGGVKIRLYTEGAAGHSFAEIQIESEYDNSGVAESAFFRSPVDANAVDIFVRELRCLEDNKVGQAHLQLLG
jgi:hypothetical protein